MTTLVYFLKALEVEECTLLSVESKGTINEIYQKPWVFKFYDSINSIKKFHQMNFD